MTKDASRSAEHPADPPIDEVVCGVRMQDVSQVDPVFVGSYWAGIRDRFPHRELQPRLPVSTGIRPPIAMLRALRTWLVSSDGQYLVQIQADRFYLNWRRRGENAYPGFQGRAADPGVLDRFTSEFEAYMRFLAATLGSEALVTHAEVTKVDVLRRGTHWSTDDELRAAVALIAPLDAAMGSPEWTGDVRMATSGPSGEFSLTLSRPKGEHGPGDTVRLESTAVVPTSSASLVQDLRAANGALNSLFGRLVSGGQGNGGSDA